MKLHHASMQVFAVSVVLGGVLAWTLFAAWNPARSNGAEQPPSAAPVKNGVNLIVTPLPDWFKFQTSDTVNGWIDSLDKL